MCMTSFSSMTESLPPGTSVDYSMKLHERVAAPEARLPSFPGMTR
jgi:hypothetical protein